MQIICFENYNYNNNGDISAANDANDADELY